MKQKQVLYLHTNHLNTPRLATDSTQTVVWRWEGAAFGNTPPNEDPDGARQVTTINLRFPGQYYDQETGLHYNWNRYYDPRTGRYITFDPIGRLGGLNTYSYALNNPLRWTDPDGLQTLQDLSYLRTLKSTALLTLQRMTRRIHSANKSASVDNSRNA